MASNSIVFSRIIFKQLNINKCLQYTVLCSESFYTNSPRWKPTVINCTARRCFSATCPNLQKTTGTPPPTLETKSPAVADLVLDDKAVTIEYYRGLPQVTVPLPSRRERCRFTLRPITNTVGDFLNMLRNEDRGIDRCAVLSGDCKTRIASSDTVEALLEDHFVLIINDNTYYVQTPKQERISQEEVKQLSDVRNLVNQLYEALNVQEHQLRKERELNSQLEDLKHELQPLEAKRQELEMVAERKTNILTWVGLGLMSVQFGILARLTWWEYSWDIMEPVTYFVTYGTAMAAYAYFVLTKQEYILPDVKDRQHLITLHKRARKLGLDINKYNSLKNQVRFLEKDLRRLRDPLNIHLPPEKTSKRHDFIGSIEAFTEGKRTTTLDKIKKFMSAIKDNKGS